MFTILVSDIFEISSEIVVLQIISGEKGLKLSLIVSMISSFFNSS
jgi:hypothetical protein